MLDTGLSYGDGEPVRIRVRKRRHRYDISDDGAAWSKAGASGRAALEAAERVVAEEGFNVNRRGVVFVPAVEGRDIARLAERLAGCSLAVYAELLELSG
jgi:ribosomal protein S12 methylthiotransferase accessory factor YcaO